MLKIIFLVFLLGSCFHSRDYYNSDKYKIKQRQDRSMEMFEMTHRVRKKSSNRLRSTPGGKRGKRYYG